MSAFWTAVSAIVAVLLMLGGAYKFGAMQGYNKARRDLNSDREAKRLSEIYAPLFGMFTTCHVTTVPGRGAPYIRQRLRNAYDILTEELRPMNALKAVFDKQDLGTSGEVEYGGEFPLSKITAHLRGKEHFADRRLLLLVAKANRAQYENRPVTGELTDEDLRLFDHISSEHEELSRRFGKA